MGWGGLEVSSLSLVLSLGGEGGGGLWLSVLGVG